MRNKFSYAQNQMYGIFTIRCDFCSKSGHVESVCFAKKNARSDSTQASANAYQSTYTFTVDLSHANTITNADAVEGKLLVDCGATCHIVNNADNFVSFDSSFDPSKHYIQLADGRRSNELATAKGIAEFHLLDSNQNPQKIQLTNALLAPKFPISLFSVRAATDSGAEISFTKDTASLTSDNAAFSIIRQGQLYFLPTCGNNSDSTMTVRTLGQWHEALGHMNHDDILRLQHATRRMTVRNVKSSLLITVVVTCFCLICDVRNWLSSFYKIWSVVSEHLPVIFYVLLLRLPKGACIEPTKP